MKQQKWFCILWISCCISKCSAPFFMINKMINKKLIKSDNNKWYLKHLIFTSNWNFSNIFVHQSFKFHTEFYNCSFFIWLCITAIARCFVSLSAVNFSYICSITSLTLLSTSIDLQGNFCIKKYSMGN